MSIPLITTNITIKRRPQDATLDPDGEGYGDLVGALETIATNVPACISGPTTTNVNDQEVERWQLRCDVTALDLWCIVIDENTGQEFEVVHAFHSTVETFGLDHTGAQLKLWEGLPDG